VYTRNDSTIYVLYVYIYIIDEMAVYLFFFYTPLHLNMYNIIFFPGDAYYVLIEFPISPFSLAVQLSLLMANDGRIVEQHE
jgi:hypothetical protein